MAQTIRLKRSALTGQSPTVVQLELGEVAINTADGNMFLKQDDQSGGIDIRRITMYHTDGEFGTSSDPISLTFNGTMDFKNDVILGTDENDAITINGGTNFVGPVSFASTPTGTDFIVYDDFSTQGTTTLGDAAGDTVTIVGNATAQNSLTVLGNTTLGDAAGDTVAIVGNTTVQNTFATLGTTTLGDTSADTVTVNGNAVFNNSASFNGNVVLGNASGDTLTVTATSTFNGNVTTTGNTVIGNSAVDTNTVNATSTFAGPATFNGGVSIQAGDTFTFDSSAFTKANKFTIKNSSGTIVKGGWMFDTDSNEAN